MSAVTADEKLFPQDPAGQKDVEHRPRTELNSNSYLRGTEFILVFSLVSENILRIAKLMHSLDRALLLSIFLVSLDQTIVSILF